MFSVSPASVLVEGSAGPGPRHNAALPSLLRCPDGSLLLAHRIGTHKNSADGTQWLWRSVDEGKSWARVPFSFAKRPLVEFRTAALSDIGGDQIAMLLTWLDHPDETAPLVNAKTEGLLPIHIGWTVSSNCGETWTSLREINVSPLVQPAGNGPMLRLPNGELLVAFETYKHYDDPSPWSAGAGIAISPDEGRTWLPKVIAADATHRLSYYDQHVRVLRDGTLLSLMWVDDRGRPGMSEIWAMRSTDTGLTWSAPAPTGIQGQYSTAIALNDGRWLMFYVLRHDDPSIRMAVGSPDGGSWETCDECKLYAQRTDDLTSSKGKGYAAYLQGMAKWTFGWPSAVRVPGGGVLASYYAGEGDHSSVFLAKVAAR